MRGSQWMPIFGYMPGWSTWRPREGASGCLYLGTYLIGVYDTREREPVGAYIWVHTWLDCLASMRGSQWVTIFGYIPGWSVWRPWEGASGWLYLGTHLVEVFNTHEREPVGPYIWVYTWLECLTPMRGSQWVPISLSHNMPLFHSSMMSPESSLIVSLKIYRN